MWIRTIKYFAIAGLLLLVSMHATHGQQTAKQALPFQFFSDSDRANANGQQEGPAFLQSPPSDASSVGFDLAKLIRRSLLFSGLAIVACLAIAFVGQQKRKRHGATSKQISVLETQVLGPRCFGDLVQIREQYLFVARDASGIKSVVPLTVAFDTELDSLDESTVDESLSQPIDSFRSRNQNETWPTKLPSRTV